MYVAVRDEMFLGTKCMYMFDRHQPLDPSIVILLPFLFLSLPLLKVVGNLNNVFPSMVV